MKVFPVLVVGLLLTQGLPVCAASIPLEERLEILLQSYPADIDRLDGGWLIMSEGTRILIDDGREKTHQQMLADPDVEDMLSQIYPLGDCFDGRSLVDFDPGRIRVDAFFKAVYGASPGEVSRAIVSIDWFGKKLSVTSVGGADRALREVAQDLAQLDDRMRKYFVKTAGTFNWRKISGTSRLSVHSFAAAIDINVDYADYWRWAGGKPGKVPNYKNRIPVEIVEIFERHGFIWGGKWYHFDTMHFEYRPALIGLARLAEKRGC